MIEQKRSWLRVWTLTSLLFLAGCHRSTPTLSLLVWEGYADPSYIRGFEAHCHCKVSASYMGSSDELIAKLRGGSAGNFDVISPSSDVAGSIAQSGLAAPLELSRIPSYAHLLPVLTQMETVKSGGKTFGIPFQWGPNPLLYDTTVFPAPPSTWSELWDPKLRGKVSVWDDLSTVYMAAQVLGYTNLYTLSDDQLGKVKAKLLELKPNIRKMWSTGGELTNLFQNHEVQIAMGWPLMTNQLRGTHFPIGETIPRERTTGWIDHLMITAGSEHKDLAYRLLEYLSEPHTQQEVVAITGYLPANPLAAQYLSAEQTKSLHLNDLNEYQKQIIFWENVPRRDKYNEVWNEVKAAQ